MSMEYSKTQLYKNVKPYFLVIILQFGYAGMSIIGKYALNKGMSEHVFIAYQHAIAAVVIAPFAIVLDRKRTPKLTFCVFAKVALIALLGPVINQNLFYTGMKYTTASFARAMCNVIPAFSFAMAWILGLEKVYLRRLRGQAKVFGTMVTVVGALLMTLVRGPMFNLPWANGNAHQESTSAANKQDITKGALMILASSLSGSGFFILQAITLKSYPAELSLTVLICLMGSLESTILALAIEWGNPTAWSIHFDIKLLATIYSGLICSGFAFYIQGVVMKERGPVFVTAFSPLSVVLVMIIGSFILSETLHMGRVIGAVVIVVGLYLVLWGKSKDQLESTSDSDNVVLTAQNMDTMNERKTTSKQEFLAIDVKSTKSTLGTT
ncbi:WAT1-related protein At2g39510 [Quercus suber]|uniref:WAT1-related protein At2g39510 n=1 Tax=Quercus suber TaxID=58331 RepID=UPI000CE1F5C0|nr:WAT1-related protein At2g39510-like [Quercus suber]